MLNPVNMGVARGIGCTSEVPPRAMTARKHASVLASSFHPIGTSERVLEEVVHNNVVHFIHAVESMVHNIHPNAIQYTYLFIVEGLISCYVCKTDFST